MPPSENHVSESTDLITCAKCDAQVFYGQTHICPESDNHNYLAKLELRLTELDCCLRLVGELLEDILEIHRAGAEFDPRLIERMELRRDEIRSAVDGPFKGYNTTYMLIESTATTDNRTQMV